MSGDYISRKAAMSLPFANDQYDHVHADPHFIAGCETYKEWLETIPAADVVEVRHGFWWPGYEVQNCSICTYRGKRSYKFCPSCGAKMDGGQNE
jgi:hypothetical protein